MIECICNDKYRVPALAVDVVVEKNNEILLIKRKQEPFKNKWALPGGFVEEGETTEKAAKREVEEETSLKIKIRDLLGVFSDPNRDPRGHVVSITYIGSKKKGKLSPSTDAKETRFFLLSNLPPLAFDHNEVIEKYKEVK